jgi:hypothetical protein
MKSEYRYRNRISTVLLDNAKISKAIFDSLLMHNLNDKLVQGFIQSISVDPFGFIIVSYYQVKFNH